MKEIGRYDTSLKMFVETLPTPDIRRLKFARFMAEKGYEHPVVSTPKGEFLFMLTDREIRDYVLKDTTDKKPSISLLDHMKKHGDY